MSGYGAIKIISREKPLLGRAVLNFKIFVKK
jgi:hypothetical protein